MQKLRPQEPVIDIIPHAVVLWEAIQIAMLHEQQVGDLMTKIYPRNDKRAWQTVARLMLTMTTILPKQNQLYAGSSSTDGGTLTCGQ